MKTFIFYMLICCSLVYMTACEKAEIQKSTASSGKIESRGGCVEDCDDCDPVEDCCCSITLLSDPGMTPADLEFCGTTSPCLTTTACTPGEVGICDAIDGFIEDITLPNQFSSAMFCVPKNAAFGIISSNGPHTVRITCQAGQTSPQSVTITLNTAPDKPYWETNGECELTECL